VQGGKEPSPTDDDGNNTQKTEGGHRFNKTTIDDASTEGNHTETQEMENQRKTQQTLMGGETPVSMEIETEMEQPNQTVDNDHQ
jgi:hypothetical protein